MRRTPYTERGVRQMRNISMKEASDFLATNAPKPELLPKSSSNVNAYMQTKNPRPYQLPSRSSRSQSKRPVSVNRSNSGLKNRSIFKFT